EDNVPADISQEYYSQRASLGGLIISEGVVISEEANGWLNAPGIWNDSQIACWKQIVDGIHAKGGFIYMQIFAAGRVASPDVLKRTGHNLASPGDIPMNEGDPAPKMMSRDDMYRYLETFTNAAKNAVIEAGFDGVEIHCANGYFLDQVISANANNRTDEFGGSVENRSRYILMLIKSVTEAIGQEKTGIRFSPYADFQNVRMPDDQLEPQFMHLITAIKDQFPKMAYLHLIEPRIQGSGEVPNSVESSQGKSLDHLREAWGGDREGSPVFAAGGHTLGTAQETIAEHGGAVVFGRAFLANPDLPLRLRHRLELNKANRETFYTNGAEGKSFPF
ncbi:hypothetical protein FRB98_004467, partial [Tulasnella sp. 332]